MSAVRNKLLSVLLLAFWLVATQHCGLEAAGLFSSHSGESAAVGCCASNEHEKKSGCVSDGCELVESGHYRTDLGAKLVVPALAPCFCVLCTHFCVAPPEPEVLLVATDRVELASAWVPVWQFERRAAAPAHAPDPLIA